MSRGKKRRGVVPQGGRNFYDGRVAEIYSWCAKCDEQIIPGHRINWWKGRSAHTSCIYRDRE